VCAVDAAHVVFGGLRGGLWCWVRLWARAPSGRRRFHVPAALDVVAHELIRVTNQTHVTAAGRWGPLLRVAEWDRGRRVTVTPDNARDPRCRAVQAAAARPGIELPFLPPGSPNRDRIERSRKFVTKECLCSKHDADDGSSPAAIEGGPDQANRRHKAKLATLLTLNFQTFDDAQFLAV
jgi:hypothetical protein